MRLPFGLKISRRPDGVYLSRGPGRKVIKRPVARLRSFTGAKSDDLTFSWGSSPEAIDTWLSVGWSALVARSMDMAANTDTGHKFIQMVKAHVIGPRGIILQARCKGPDGRLDTLANDAIEEAFRAWGRPESCAMSGTTSWVQLQEMFVSMAAIYGEALFLKYPGQGPHGFRLHPINPALLDVNYNRELRDGHRIRMGVEVDRFGRPLAYHIQDGGRDGNPLGTGISGQHIRFPADRVVHKFLVEYPGQTRGVPWMAPALLRMQMLAGFEEAALVNARVGASKVGVITNETGEDFSGDDYDASTGDMLMNADPGTWVQLANGESIDSWNPDYPNGEVGPFVKSVLQRISTGLGVDYAGLSGDLSDTNYSSMRAGLLETRESWKRLQEWAVESLCRPVFLDWLGMALAAGVIMVPSRTGPAPLRIDRFEKYSRAFFQGRRWNWVDPLKDGQAAKLYIDERMASRSGYMREMGQDPEEVWREIANENERMEALEVPQPVGARDLDDLEEDLDAEE